MRTQPSDVIRRSFLDFFASKGHQICPSASLIPNDPTLLFVNAGMVPFKDVFTGKERRDFSRATSSQKCIRISGKHNDLENVGRTARHHTFFEMLGNFSFGDYFKEEAIAYAWELITKEWDLPQERLILTVFGGEDGLPPDDEARALWQKTSGFAPERIRGMGKADNFWQMGETGPCGPCSEIHVWLGPIPPGGVPYQRFGEEPDALGVGWFEIWNLVFMQFDRQLAPDGSSRLVPLPRPSIDTGAGLERIACVLQGVTSNYDTDLLRPLVEKAASLAGKSYQGSMSDDDVSMRVIADHARMAAFTLAEGIYPERDGREYVLRRVLRRAIRHGHRLGIQKPFLYQVALEAVRVMGSAYPELEPRKNNLAAVLEQEEVRFRNTIDRGLKLLDEHLAHLATSGSRVLSGASAFELYDTYGFPVDLTDIILQERGATLDQAGFERELELARERSRGSTLNKDESVEKVYYETLEKVPGRAVSFTGYDTEQAEGTVVALLVNGTTTEQVAWEGGTGPLPLVDVIVDATPFYGRGGGQVGDTGEIRSLQGTGRIAVLDTVKPIAGLIVHQGQLSQGHLAVGERVVLQVDHARRAATRRNHSATHLLHWALGTVLGEHIEQKGSLVSPDTLRFDFSHNAPLTPGQWEQVEDLVNEHILTNAAVQTEVLPIAQARSKGAKAIFEEKYGDTVRMLTMGISIELCGGTHVQALGDIGMFKLVSEGGVAAGVRRIEAATGLNALAYVRKQEHQLREVAREVKAAGDVLEAVKALAAKKKETEKELAQLKRTVALQGNALAAGEGSAALASHLVKSQVVEGIHVAWLKRDGVEDPALLRELAEQYRDQQGESVVLVGSKTKEKAMLVLTVSKPLTSRLRAGDLIRPIAAHVGGKGGGRPDMAQAGGPDREKLDEALELLFEHVSKALAP